MIGLLLATWLSAAPPEFELRTAQGASSAGPLTVLSAERVAVGDGAEQLACAAAEVMTLLPRAAPASASGRPSVWVVLVDGSLLVGSGYAVTQDEARLSLADGRGLVLPTRAIRSVRLKEQSVEQQRQWAEIHSAQQAADLIVIRKEAALDYLGGVVRDVTPDNVQFEIDGEILPVKREKVEGLVYYRGLGASPTGEFATLEDSAGNQVRLASADVKGLRLRAVTPAGVELELPLASITAIRFKTLYLSDLKPESVSWTAYVSAIEPLEVVERFYRARFNTALGSGPLRLGGVEYEKGLALHSRSEVVFRLPERYRALRTIAGIDDRVRPGGNVVLQIFGDDRTLFEDVLTGRDKPRLLEIDLRGVTRLRIVVDFGGELDTADHLVLCDPRIFP